MTSSSCGFGRIYGLQRVCEKFQAFLSFPLVVWKDFHSSRNSYSHSTARHLFDPNLDLFDHVFIHQFA
jgi:hypothetical protein